MSISRRSVLLTLGLLVFLVLGYFYVSHLQTLNHAYYPLKKKYEHDQVRVLCQQKGHDLLILCYKDEFYANTRVSNPYERIYLMDLFLHLYKRDLVLTQTNAQKARLKIEFLEISYTYLLLRQSFKINRQNLQAGAILLAKYFAPREDDFKKFVSEVLQSLNIEIQQEETYLTEIQNLRLENLTKKLTELIKQ